MTRPRLNSVSLWTAGNLAARVAAQVEVRAVAPKAARRHQNQRSNALRIQGKNIASRCCVLKELREGRIRCLPVVSRPLLGQRSSNQKNAKARTSMLCRGGAPGGEAGSLKEVCGVKRARPSFIES